MTLRRTPWDDPHFGLESMELAVTDADSDGAALAEAEKVLSSGRVYCAAKIPMKRVFLVHALEEKGFRFLETQAELHLNLSKDFHLEKYLLSVAERGRIEPVSIEDFPSLLSRLDGVFDSDRICLDPALGPDVSLLRYRSWLSDRFGKDGAHISWIIADGKRAGFFFLESEGDFADSALAGLFSEFKGSGYAPLIISSHIGCAKELGCRKLVTRVSMNNMESLRLHLAFGYQIATANYVMRHIGE